MTKRLLLTGAGGFVGHHTLEHVLTLTDWHVVCLDSFRHRGTTSRLSDVLARNPEWRSRVTVLSHDLTVPIDPVLAGRIGHIDAVINMASESHVDRSIIEPRSFIENNVNLVLTMLEWAREAQPDVFLHVSTDEVYGPAPKGHDHAEWEPHVPSNPYSASKAAQTDVAISYWRTYDVPLILTQTMNIIGERQDTEKFVPMVIKRVLAGEKVQIHASPEGEVGSRFYLHARNQADALVYLIRQQFEMLPGWMTDDHESLRHSYGGSRPLRYNVVGELEVDNLTMAKKIAESAGRPLIYELQDFHSSRPGHDLRYALDGKRMSDAGWRPPVPLWDSLAKTVRWSMDNPEWLH